MESTAKVQNLECSLLLEMAFMLRLAVSRQQLRIGSDTYLMDLITGLKENWCGYCTV